MPLFAIVGGIEHAETAFAEKLVPPCPYFFDIIHVILAFSCWPTDTFEFSIGLLLLFVLQEQFIFAKIAKFVEILCGSQ